MTSSLTVTCVTIWSWGSVVITIHTYLIQSTRGVWPAKPPFTRSPRWMCDFEPFYKSRSFVYEDNHPLLKAVYNDSEGERKNWKWKQTKMWQLGDVCLLLQRLCYLLTISYIIINLIKTIFVKCLMTVLLKSP